LPQMLTTVPLGVLSKVGMDKAFSLESFARGEDTDGNRRASVSVKALRDRYH
jgi:hypothetical protein